LTYSFTYWQHASGGQWHGGIFVVLELLVSSSCCHHVSPAVLLAFVLLLLHKLIRMTQL